MSQLHTNGVLKNLSVDRTIPCRPQVEYQSSSTKDPASLRQFGKSMLSGWLMGYAPFTEGAEKETYSLQKLVNCRRTTCPDVYLRRIETKVLVSGDIFIFPFFERFFKVDRKKVLKSDHPTEFGKTSKKEKNTVHCHRQRGRLFATSKRIGAQVTQ